jgi:hypothetical protein
MDKRIETPCGDTHQEHRDIGQFSGAPHLLGGTSRDRTLTIQKVIGRTRKLLKLPQIDVVLPE